MASPPATSKTTKLERYNTYIRKLNTTKLLSTSSKLLFRLTLLIALVLIFFFTFNNPPISNRTTTGAGNHRVLATTHLLSSAFYGSGASWEKEVRRSSTPRRVNGFSVLVTGAGGFVGTHCSLALKKRGDGVLGLDNFNSYYDPSLKRARQKLLKQHEVFVVEGDLNDGVLLSKLFDIVPFTHVLHLAAQAGVRYAMQNPQSYVRSNIAGFVNLLEVAKTADPQPSIVWASSSSVYGLNSENPFSETHRTDQPASLYAATKKAGEEIAHTYNHIYGLAITGLRFFTVYGPWGRPDMAYFFFTKEILQGKPINVYRTHDGKEVARDFTYIDDVVKGIGYGSEKSELRLFESSLLVGKASGLSEIFKEFMDSNSTQTKMLRFAYTTRGLKAQVRCRISRAFDSSLSITSPGCRNVWFDKNQESHSFVYENDSLFSFSIGHLNIFENYPKTKKVSAPFCQKKNPMSGFML